MSLSVASINASLSWTQNKTNTGFSDTIQGGDSLSAAVSPPLSGAGAANALFAEQRTLTASTSQTYDLQSMTDMLSQSLVLTGVYALMITCSVGQVTLTQGAANPLAWPLAGTSPSLTVISGGTFILAQSTAQAVNGTAKTLKVTAGGVDATYKIAILGGQ